MKKFLIATIISVMAACSIVIVEPDPKQGSGAADGSSGAEGSSAVSSSAQSSAEVSSSAESSSASTGMATKVCYPAPFGATVCCEASDVYCSDKEVCCEMPSTNCMANPEIGLCCPMGSMCMKKE